MFSSDWVSLLPHRKIRVCWISWVKEKLIRPTTGQNHNRTEYGYVTHEYCHLHDHLYMVWLMVPHRMIMCLTKHDHPVPGGNLAYVFYLEILQPKYVNNAFLLVQLWDHSRLVGLSFRAKGSSLNKNHFSMIDGEWKSPILNKRLYLGTWCKVGTHTLGCELSGKGERQKKRDFFFLPDSCTIKGYAKLWPTVSLPI